MQRSLAGVIVLLTASLAFGQDALKTPAEQFEAIRAELFKELDTGKAQKGTQPRSPCPVPQDTQAIYARYLPRLLQFAEKHAKDETSFDSLLLIVKMVGYGKITKDGPGAKALAILEKDYAIDNRILWVMPTLSCRGDDADLPLLKAVLTRSPNRRLHFRAIQGVIGGRYGLIKTAEMLGWGEYKEHCEKLWGEAIVKNIQASVPKYTSQIAEYENLLETRYAGVFPSVGKVAPEVVSKDLDGKEVRLSQYRGKVVVLEIGGPWGQLTLSPMAADPRPMPSYRHKLVTRLEGKPFVFISIHTEAEKESVVNFLKKEPMPWVHWWNGATGGILEDWYIEYYPMVYLLDHKGVIRYKAYPGEVIDTAVNRLLKEKADDQK